MIELMRLALVLAATIIPVLPAAAAPAFVFTRADLKLLDEANAIDRELDARGLVLHDAAIDQYIAGIGRSVLPPGDLENVRWQFHVLRDPTVNAFALPNGSVYINSGLLARAENDDQVAGVLAHEATHVANRHGYLANRSIRRKTLIMNAAEWAVSIPGGTTGLVLQTINTLGQTAIVLSVYGYSRELERDADLAAIERVRGAGRRTEQLARMLAIVEDKLEPEPVPYFYHDHPRTRERIEYLKDKIGGTGDLPPAEEPGYVARLRPVVLGDVQLAIDARRFRSAVAAAARVAAANPDDAAGQFWLGEAYRNLGPRRPRLTEAELTNGEQRKAYRTARNLTEDEESRKLAETDEGRAALRDNRAKAEELFRRAATLDRSDPRPYFGLGSLFQDDGRSEDAIAAYRKYVELAPAGADRDRAQRRLEALRGAGGGK